MLIQLTTEEQEALKDSMRQWVEEVLAGMHSAHMTNLLYQLKALSEDIERKKSNE